MLVALAGVVFTVAFSVVVRERDRWAQWVSAITLTTGALLAVPVFLALYVRLRDREPQFAVLGLMSGVIASFATAMHGAFDYAGLSKPFKPDLAAVPSSVDPRGFMTFAITGLALMTFGAIALRAGGLPALVARLALVAGLLLVVVYFGRLIVLNPKSNIIKTTALASGLIVSPAFFAVFGRELLTGGARRPS